MKKSISILFLLLLLANGIGFYVFYVLQLYQIKAEMREVLRRLPDDQLEILKLTDQQYHESMVEDGEIKVNGKMYDVARISHINGHVKVYCLHDEKEDNLFAFVNEIVAKPIKNKDSIPPSVFKFISLIFLGTDTSLDFTIVRPDEEHQSKYHFSLKATFSETFTPPPRPIFLPTA